MGKILTALIACIVMMAAGPAQAGTYYLNFNGDSIVNSSNSVTIKAVITTSDTLNQFGGYFITSMTGTVNGTPILGLDPLVVQDPSTPPYYGNANFLFDDTLYLETRYVGDGVKTFYLTSIYGIGFSTPGVDYDLQYAWDEGFLYGVVPGSSFLYGGTLTITDMASATPEPSAWALMIVGLGMVGAMLRRRRALAGRDAVTGATVAGLFGHTPLYA